MTRLDNVSSAAEQWAHQLTDMSGRNRLLYYKHLRVGTLDLTSANPDALERLLLEPPGTKVQLRKLFPPPISGQSDCPQGSNAGRTTGGTDSGVTSDSQDLFVDAVKSARSIARTAITNYEERGLRTLFLTQGMATWVSETSQSIPAAPVLMCPAELRRRGASENDYDVSIGAEWTVNEAMLQSLAQHFGVDASSEDLLGSYLDDARLCGTEVDAICADLSNRAHYVAGFAINKHQVILGNFMYRKMPMVSEIQQNLELLADNDIISAMAGSTQALGSLRTRQVHKLDPTEPDITHPADEYLVLDADSSQNAAINAAIGGESFVLQGPPGTGKSQTIANLIATMMARGKSVLFVAEKRAAIEAVSKRLTAVGLNQFVLDLHGGAMSRRQIALHLGDTLNTISKTPPTNHTELHDKLAKSRKELSIYADELHKKREPWGLSHFETQVRLHEMDSRKTRKADGGTSFTEPVIRFSADVLMRIGETQATQTRRHLRDWADLAEPLLSGRSPWMGAAITTTDQVREALESLEQLRYAISSAQDDQTALLSDLGLINTDTQSNDTLQNFTHSNNTQRDATPQDNIQKNLTQQDYRELLDLLKSVEYTCSQFTEKIFEINLRNLINDLAPAKRGLIHKLKATIVDSRYRSAKRSIRDIWRSDADFHLGTALKLIESAHVQSCQWQSLGISGLPRLPENLDEAVTAHKNLNTAIETLSRLIPGRSLDRHPQGLAIIVEQLSGDLRTLHRLPQLHEIEQQLQASGVDIILNLVRSGKITSADVVEAFDRAWLLSIQRETLLVAPKLAAFDGQRQSRHTGEFQRHDVDHLRRNPARIRRLIAEHVIKASNEHHNQSNLIRREAAKKTRHLPLRELMARAPNMLTAIQPCWAMSPLDVSHSLPVQQMFHLVVFDEASQVLPCDAVPALLRAPQAVVVGDSRQLPPTVFFDGSETDESSDDDSDDDSLSVFESILDVFDAMMNRRTITWHYRSQDERLIAYSNSNFYHGSLITFPSANVGKCPRFELVEHRADATANTRSNPAEVNRVVDLMIQHARQRPEQSLGVIAMGMYHANRIEETLRKRIREEHDVALERFFDDSADERAFVKNLERVQGDERDAIILSIGYGKNADGRLMYRFGPLNNEGGERRMNVAITRARQDMTLVSSFSHAEMDPSRLSATGAQHLYGYLKYAESGRIENQQDQVPLNPFEVDVLDKLQAQGLGVIPQYGYSGFRIDFAVRHPREPDRFVLAVEADGASYHSSNTARDRDRLRQEHLERLGWRFCRIWSTDWFNNHSREVDRVMVAYQKAIDEIGSESKIGVKVTTSSTVDTGTTPTRATRSVHSDTNKTRETTTRSYGVSHGVSQSESTPTPTNTVLRNNTSQQYQNPPIMQKGIPINKHPQQKLVELAQWVMSDGYLRTDEQIFEAMFKQLGYRKRGSRIKDKLYKAIGVAKHHLPKQSDTSDT